jgi:hypothetical protein
MKRFARATNLEPFEQVTLLLYLMKNGLPAWAKNEVEAFAKLMNVPQRSAKAAFEGAVRAGYLGRR